MQLDLSVLNQKGAPALYEDTLANRPTAGFVGRLFVSTDTDELYRDNGATWDLIGGGGGGAVGDGVSILGAGTIANPFNSGLDAILAIGQALTANRVFKFNNKNVEFTDNKITQFKRASNGNTVLEINDTAAQVNLGFPGVPKVEASNGGVNLNSATGDYNFYFTNTAFGALDVVGPFKKIGIYCDIANLEYLFGDGGSAYLQISTGGTGGLITWANGSVKGLDFLFDTSYKFGDQNNVYFDIQTTGSLKSYYSGQPIGFDFDYVAKSYIFGHNSGVGGNNIAAFEAYSNISTLVAQTRIHTFENFTGIDLELTQDSNADTLYFSRNASDIGLLLDFQSKLYKFGDFNGILSPNAYMYIDGANNSLRIGTNELEFDSTAMITGTAGGSSGQHLIIKVAGTTYKIALLT